MPIAPMRPSAAIRERRPLFNSSDDTIPNPAVTSEVTIKILAKPNFSVSGVTAGETIRTGRAMRAMRAAPIAALPVRIVSLMANPEDVVMLPQE